jgi:hypothetical protein
MRINLIDLDRKHADYFLEQNKLKGKTLVGFIPAAILLKYGKKRWDAENTAN